MAEPPDRRPLVLLYGGMSAEHEISCISARWALAACDPARYRLSLAGIGTDGRWVDATGAAMAADPEGASLPDPDDLLAAGAPEVEPWAAVHPGPGGVVWPVLHGPMGEDGTVQGLLELAGTAYVGASVAGSAAAMDKALAKVALDGAGLPQTRWLAARVAGAPDPAAVEDLAGRVGAELGWPAYIKPANMGSSIGVHRVAGPADLADAVADAAAYDEALVLEEAVVGREIEVAVLGDEPVRVSRPGEIVPSHDLYDFDDKYRDGTAELRVPVSLPAEVEEEAGRLARAACRALRVEHMARVDLFYVEGAADGRRLLVNEVNTLPGLTPISMYPALWAASGLGAAALADELVALALRRRDRRQGRRTRRA